MTKQLLFILKGDVKNPRWELRNRNVRIPKKENGKNVGLREIQFIPGASSIWKEENQDEGTPESIWFEDGSLAVDADDKVKIDFMKSHPEFDVKFELFDPEAKAEAEIEAFERSEEAVQRLREMAEQDPDRLHAVAVALFGATAMNWKEKTCKMRCFNYARSDAKSTLTAMDDPATEAKYMSALALKKQIVITNPAKTAIMWNNKDKGIVCNIPAGQKALTALGDFLFDDANLVTLQTIGEKLGLTSKKKSSKSKSKQKKEDE